MQQKFDPDLNIPDLKIRPVVWESHDLASAPRSLEKQLVAQLMLDLAILIFLTIHCTDTVSKFQKMDFTLNLSVSLFK